MNRYFLHYIGKGLYTRATFVREAERHGVNRAISASVLGRMEFGENVLLAQYEPVGEGKGAAVVFGYFPIQGLNLQCDRHEELMSELTSQLDVVDVSRGGGRVHRACGSYVIDMTVTVRDSLASIVARALKIAGELGVKVRFFAGGPFKQLPEIEVRPIAFSRSGLYVELDEGIERVRVREGAVSFMGDYRQRKYFLRRHPRSEDEEDEAPSRIGGAPSRVGR